MEVKTIRKFTHASQKALIQHMSRKPPQPSWDLPFTTMAYFLKSFIDPDCVDIPKIRKSMAKVPIPRPLNCFIKPYNIHVQPKVFPGVLEHLSTEQSEERVIDGEWITADEKKSSKLASYEPFRSKNKTKHQKRTTEHEANNTSKKVILYLHGGGYILMSAGTHRGIICSLAKHTGCSVLAINYRLAPEHPFPNGLLDALYAYLHLIDVENGPGYEPKNIFIAGDSAGGGLTLALNCYLRDNGSAMPAGIIALSPWVKPAEKTSDDANSLDYIDFNRYKFNAADLYRGSHPIDHPYITLVNGDLNNLPPILVQYGEMETLNGQIQELVEKIKPSQNTFVRAECYKEMTHVFHLVFFHNTAVQAFKKIHQFIRDVESNKCTTNH